MTRSHRPVALITGAAKRVGRAIALELATAGHDIALHYHDSHADAEQTAKEIRSNGGRAELICADLYDPAAPENIVNLALERFSRIDVLVNNASVFQEMRLEDFEAQKFHDTLTINLCAPLKLCQLVAPFMKKSGGGCIVNLSDINAARPWPHHLAYGCSKAGIDYITRALARSLAPAIRVNAVAPGIAVFPDSYPIDLRQQLVDSVPLKREGTPQDIAGAVRFLVESPYITGQILNIDGGRSII